jgi:protein-S-isoprenylcysteine O-methyltransferase Ste14
MITASSASYRASRSAIKSIGGVDVSSWLSWCCYSLGFAVAIHLAPESLEDLTNGGRGAMVLVGAVALFFALVLVIQHQMNVSLRNSAFGSPRKLTTHGFFALSRNPMYAAFLVPLLSLTVVSPLAAIASAALYVLAMNSLVIINEEEALLSSFGGQYRRYSLETPRWLVW